MSNIDEIPSEGGFVNWDKLEGKTDSKPKKKKAAEELDEDIVDEMKNLTEDEKDSPYPDEFLADIKNMRKDLGVHSLDISHLKDDEEEK